jgi:hypothetical protein
MNIHTQLNELTREALGFSDVIHFTDNPLDADFCNACRLFSDYLTHQLESLDCQLNLNKASESTRSITDQLHKLGSLIRPEQIDPDNTAPWTSKLDSYCRQLETLRQVAA